MSESSDTDLLLSSGTGSVSSDGSLSRTAVRVERRALSKATRRHRRSVLRQFLSFVRPRQLPYDQRSAIKFLHGRLFKTTRPLAVTSAIQYASVLCLDLSARELPITRLQDYRRGLRRSVKTSIRRALPMPLTVLMTLVRNPRVTAETRALFALMWSTVSRFSDTTRLTGADIRINDDYVLVVFGRTKANREASPRLDHLGLVPVRLLPTDVLAVFRKARLAPDDPLFRASPSQVRTTLRRIPAGMAPQRAREVSVHDVRDHYTLHSIKRGAVGQAVMVAATCRHTVPIDMVPLLAKHRCAWQTRFPDTTVGYAPNLFHLARASGIEDAVSHMWQYEEQLPKAPASSSPRM